MYVLIHINGITTEEVCTKGSGKLPFSEYLGQRTGIFKVSNTCTNLCNNMVEENVGAEEQNSEKGFEKNEHACIVEGVLGFRIFLPVWNLKAAGQTTKIQS